MATTTDKPTAKELREQRAEREASEQAKLAEARERVAAEEAEATKTAGRNGSGPHVDAQDGLFDKTIDNLELLEALEQREKRKASKQAVTKTYQEADEKAKALISGCGLEVGETARVGRFRIQRTEVEGRSVAFETEPSERLTITPTD